MRLLFGVIALLALAGCASAERQMVARAKAECAGAIAKAPWRGTLSWKASQQSGGSGDWLVDGALEPQRRVGVTVILSPDGKLVLACNDYRVLGPNDTPNAPLQARP
jgi:hypothetical protein